MNLSWACSRRESSLSPTWSCRASRAELSAPENFQMWRQSRRTNPRTAAIRSKCEILKKSEILTVGQSTFDPLLRVKAGNIITMR